jgi:ribulose 1,5-bisphosphate carboxylase large subunit-like protein
MKHLSASTLDSIKDDCDAREIRLREIISERLPANPPRVISDQVVATYYFSCRTWRLAELAKEIAYHATSGTKDIPSGSLLEACTGKLVHTDAWDANGRMGLEQMAYPLKMLLQADGHLTSVDLLHTLAGAIIFDVYEVQDARLIDIQLPESVLRTFPGPAQGPMGIRALTGFKERPMFGTILKPTAGITPTEVGALVEEAAQCPLFCFVKEDENLYPRLNYSPAPERTRRAVEAIQRAQDKRQGLGLVFAPHVTGAPHEILETVHSVLDAGATGVMFSESFAGGLVRMVREATRSRPSPPAIYGHNAGIGVKTRSIFREVIDTLARLDGIDFRQTAPVRAGVPFLKPFGAEWEASEAALSREIPGIKPTTIVRAGALDQGNISLNMADAERRGISQQVLFLSGSAINSIKNSQGKPDAGLGAEAMLEAIEVHRSGELRDVGIDEHLRALFDLANRRHLRALSTALRQRYPILDSDPKGERALA